jgi:hypothetical protein
MWTKQREIEARININDTSGSIEGDIFVEDLRDYYVLNKDSVHFS